jgi:hypothetical protein
MAMGTGQQRPSAAKSVVAKAPAGKGKKIGVIVGGIAGGLLVLLFLGLFIGRSVAVGRVRDELNKHVGPAASWDIDCGLFTGPKLALGGAVDFAVHAKQLQLPGKPPLKSVDVAVEGFAVDLHGPKVKAVEKVSIDAVLSDEALATFLRNNTSAAGKLQGLTVKFAGDHLELSGMVSLFGYQEPLTVTAAPELTKPAKVALRVQKAVAGSADKQHDVPLGLLANLVSADLTFDLARMAPGLVLDSVVVEEGGLRFRGGLDTKALMGGNNGPPGSPGAPPPAPHG